MYVKTYSELITIPTYEDRFRYLKLGGKVGEATFGLERYLNQTFYKCPEWLEARDKAIIRDEGCDMAFPGYEIHGRIKELISTVYLPEERQKLKWPIIIVHHINPITIEDIQRRSPKLFDLENLITTAHKTHNAIHYGDESFLIGQMLVTRKPNDTCPWKK